MTVFLVSCFLTITFLSQGWGKHYLLETRDAKKYHDDGTDHFGLDITTADAKTLMKTYLKDNELAKFKSWPEKTKKRVINKINKILDNVRNGLDLDYWYRPEFRETSFSRQITPHDEGWEAHVIYYALIKPLLEERHGR